MHMRGVPPYALMAIVFAIEHGYYDKDKTQEERDAIRDAIVDDFVKTVIKND